MDLEPNFDDFNNDTNNGYIHKIHVNIQPRKSKWVTTITNIPDEFDHEKIIKAMKKLLSCNGVLIQDENHGPVIQLQGKHNQTVCTWLVDQGIADREQLVVHGF
eukprot:TRINITY_DN8468_c0_g1_i1.p1 TRINITY_DN8468_c0_g1~~TRINITY_DN8468_c0_g1_i1.p1  ORF type:complete len:104 (+),score=28.33 TRINITY_DN8468_c0_g1_i1:52-363(+)